MTTKKEGHPGMDAPLHTHPDSTVKQSRGTIPGASPAEWHHFVTEGLAEDLLPVVSDQNGPISPNSKMKSVGKTPSIINRSGHTAGFKDWPSKRATVEEIARWSSDDRLGICIQTRTVRALDVDVPDLEEAQQIADMIVATLPPGVRLPRRGRGNSAKFLLAFKMPGEFAKRSFKTAHGLVEFLATGQQFIAAGMHPSGARYEWAGGLPSNIPHLTPEQFENLWTALEARFAVAPTVEARRGTAPSKPRTDDDISDPLVDYLYANWEVYSTDRTGRVDIECPFADGHSTDSSESSTSYFPAGVGGFDRGHFRCLHTSCAHRKNVDFLEKIGWMEAGFDEVECSDEALKPRKAPERPREDTPKATPYPAPFRGAMAVLHAEIMRASPRPQAALSTLACLIGMAGGVSGYYRHEDGLRCNLYGLGVALSGAGKDAPQGVAREAAHTAGGKLIGQPASGEGLEDALESRRGMLCVLDEIAHILGALNTQKAAHLVSLSRNLLTLFSASKGRYTLRQRASKEKGRRDDAEVIENPCFSLLGFATPEKLGEAATASNIEDGLLGRMLFALGEDPPQRRVKHKFEVPVEVEQVAQRIQDTPAAAFDDGGEIVIRPTPAADAALDALLLQFDRQARAAESDPLTRTLCIRSYEKAFRIAGVLAVWDCPEKPEMALEHVEWALLLVEASNAAARRFLSEYLHGGEVQRNAAEIKRHLQRLKQRDGGMVPHSELLRASTKKINAHQFEVAVSHLLAMDDIERLSVETTAGRKSWLYS